MKAFAKKTFGMVMAVVLAITSMCFGTYDVVSGDVTADVNIVNNGDWDIINNFANTTFNYGGKTYNNYMRYKGVSAESNSSIQNDYNAIDGKTNSRWESQHGVNDVEMIVDLGNVYAIDAYAIYWEDACAKEYTLQVSNDGSTFTDIKNVRTDSRQRTDFITFSESVNARYIKVKCVERGSAFGYSIFEMAALGMETQKEVIKNLSNLKVTSYAKYTGKYLVYFNEASDAESYNLYLDDEAAPFKSIKKSGSYLTNTELANYSNGEHTLSICSVKTVEGAKVESASISTKFTKENTLGSHSAMPQVYISGKNITNEYHEDSDFSVTVVDADGGSKGWAITDDSGTKPDADKFSSYADIVDSSCNMKIRGNTTAGQPKKGWNIKFSSKTSFLGMPKGKKWNLLANSMDKSLVRDYLSYNFALENGVRYTSQSRYAEVYLNGTFVGNYQICEPVEAKTGRVEVDAYDAANNDILLELGTRNEEGVDHFTTDVLRTTFDVNDPEKGDDLTDTQVDTKIANVKNFLNGFENALKQHSLDGLGNYMDIDSFVDFYVVNELFKNQDFNFSSTRFYIKDNKVYAGPIWDLDLSSGNIKSTYYTDSYVDGDSAKGFKCKSMNWYKELFKTNGFEDLVKARYEGLQYKIQSLYRTDSIEPLSINYLKSKYGDSFNRNYASKDLLGAGWPVHYEDGYSYAGESNWQSFDDAVELLRAWLVRRNTWLCNEYNIDMEKAYVNSMPVEETTTEAPTTTQEPTTVAITTTQESTIAPTTEPVTAPQTTSESITKKETTAEPTIEKETTTKLEDTSWPITNQESTKPNITRQEVSEVTTLGKVVVKKAVKKKRTKKLSLTIKRVRGAKGYQVAVYKTKANAAKNKKAILKKYYKTNKAKFSITSTKLKGKKRLFIRVRAYVVVDGHAVHFEWSAIKKTK